MMRARTLALLVREVMIGDTEHVHLDAGGNERDRRARMLRNTWRCVQRDRGPDILDVAVRRSSGFSGDKRPIMVQLRQGALRIRVHAFGVRNVGSCSWI
jgi:hypothetical protein